MTIREQMTQRFPVRRTPEQKEAFRRWIQDEAGKMGYSAQVEEAGKHQNVVIGAPETAQAIFTAHYDTPVGFFLPNFMTPRNRVFKWVKQVGMILLFALLGTIVGVPVWLLTDNGRVGFLAGYAVYMFLAVGMLIGPANKNNVNDNTSGVAAVLELMARIPEEKRATAAFILFDNEEKGLLGSKAYARDHLEMQHTRFVVNADSVGVGDVFLLAAPALAVQLPQYARLEKLLAACPDREVRFHSSVTTRVNSDFRSFKCGVGIGAYRQVGGVGLYLGDLHTARDTQADQRNIECLAEAFSVLAEQI